MSPVPLNQLMSLPARTCVFFRVGAESPLAQVDGKGTKIGRHPGMLVQLSP